MKQIRIGISCIGSGVGQSVIESCNLSNLPLYTIGFGTNPLAYGLYECDEYAYTKSFYDPDYISDIIQHCLDKKVDIFFPGHDDDAHVVSKNIKRFEENNIKVVVAGEELLDLCRDKEKMSFELNQISKIFVQSFDYDSFIKSYKAGDVNLPVIAKPNDGYASKGIEIINSEEDFSRIDDSLIIQELAIPHKDDVQRSFFDKKIKEKQNPQIAEISIQIVADQNSNIMGKMISYNKLNNGVPIEIIPYENDEIWKEIDKLYPTFRKLGLKGPFNLQGRLTDTGLKLFEMNARFTGITGLRAYMGFNEVEMCIKEWMGLRQPDEQLVFNYNKFGIRQVANKAISFDWNKTVKAFSTKVNKENTIHKKNILITGATGFIGQNLIEAIEKKYASKLNVWAFTRNKQKAKDLFQSTIELYDEEDLRSGVLAMGNVDVLLHLGFARPHKTNTEIAESLAFTSNLFTQAVKNQVPEIINISSQSVYGKTNNPPWKEEDLPAPDFAYSQAKYASELLLNSLVKFHPHIHATSLRLAAVTGALSGAVIQDLPSKLVKQALDGKTIQIHGGEQQLEFLDVRDVIDALIAFLSTDSSKWQSEYNLGAHQIYSLNEIVSILSNVYEDKFSNPLQTERVTTDKLISLGMNANRFKELTGWTSSYTLKNSFESLINYWTSK